MATVPPNSGQQPATVERFVTPDLARGLMLALIAVVNIMIYLHDRPFGLRQYVLPDNVLDQVVTVIVMATADSRAYPLFAALFGYGIVQMISRRQSRGIARSQINRLLRRRNLGLILFGAIHAGLAFSGEILGWYGLLGLIMLPLLRLSDRALLRLALIWLVVASTIQGLIFADSTVRTQRSYFWSYAIPDPLEAAGWRIVEWVMTPFGLLAVVSAMLIGAVAARHQILEHPEQHRLLLRRTALAGIPVGLIVGATMGLVAAGVWAPGAPTTTVLSCLHVLTGVMAGLGYAALIALIAIRLTARGKERNPIVVALQATGKRSLSCYLAQSVAFAILLPAATLGWGAWLGPASASLLALLVWAATVLGSWALGDRRGPAEALLQRLVTGRSTPLTSPRE